MVLTPIQRFFSGIPEQSSQRTYKLYLDKFFKWGKITHDEFIGYERKGQESLFEQYIFYLRGVTDRTGKYQNSYNLIISPLKLFCTMNDVAINWARLYKMFPKTKRLSNQGAYDDDDIRLFLDSCNSLRDKVFVHFMASTAVRIGEVHLLNIGDITPYEDGAIVMYYAGQKEEYKVCLTPEAYDYLKKYLETRINKKPEAPLFATKKGIVERRLAQSTVLEFMKELRYKALPNELRDGKRKHKAPNNAFRKRLENIFADVDVNFRYASYLLDHNKSKQDPHYFRDIKNDKLWIQFKKAIPLITLDKSNQIIATKDDEIEKLRESYEGEFKEKLEQQDELMQQMMLQMASAKYFAYETRYVECFGGKNPDLKKLAKLMSNEEIQDWNKIIPLVQREKDWTIPIGTKSNEMLRDSKQKREIKELIKKIQKKGDSEETIKQLKEMLDEL